VDYQNNYVRRSNWLLECQTLSIVHYAWVSYIIILTI